MTELPCPDCGAALSVPATACAQCGLVLTGPAAARLWEVDQRISALRTERGDLLARMRAGDTTLPAPAQRSDAAWAVGAGAGASAGPGAAPAVARHRRVWSGQQVLLGTGVLLLVVAAVVFLAVAWDLLGVGGQVTVMAVLTLTTGVGALRAARSGLGQTAEALGVLAAGLLVVDLLAARWLDLAGLQRVESEVYVTLASVLAAAVLSAASWLDRRVASFGVAAAAAALLAPVAALAAADASAAAVGVAALAVTVAASALAAVLLRVRPAATVVLGLGALGYLVTSGAAALGAAVDALDPAARWTGSVTLVLTAVLALAAAGRPLPRRAAAGGRALSVVVAVVAGPLGLVTAAERGGDTGLLVLAGVSCAAALALLWTGIGAHRVGGLLGLVSGAEAALALVEVGHDVSASVAFAFVAVTTAAGAVRRPRLRTALATGSGLAGVLAAGFAGVAVSDEALAWAGVLAALAVLAVAAWRSGRPEEAALAVPVAFGAGTAVVAAVAADGAGTLLSVVLGALGLAALGYAVLPRRGWVAVLGVAGCSASTWVAVHDAGIRVVEAYSLPLAGLALAVGGARWYLDRSAPSWATVGPGLSAALLPSAVTALSDEGLLRPGLTLAAAVLVLAAGLLVRWQAPLVTGAVAAGLVAASQLAPYAVGLPRWLVLATAGALLLGFGATYERRLVQARTARRWVARLD